MPCRSNSKPLSKFAFVTVDSKVEGVSWIKTHSSAARSHAAYWSGPHRHQGQLPGRHTQTSTTTVTGDPESTPYNNTRLTLDLVAPQVERRSSDSSQNDKVVTLPPGTRFEPPHHGKFHRLCRLLSETPSQTEVPNSFAPDLPLSKFWGGPFIKQFLMSDHEDHAVLVDSCLLLTYAQHMALTGRGTLTALLERKRKIFRHIRLKVEISDSLLSPQYVFAVLALGAPIVCLVSQNLPKRLTMLEYIFESSRNDSLCSPEFARVAERAHEEQLIYRQAICRLLSRSKALSHDAEDFALLRHIINSMNV